MNTIFKCALPLHILDCKSYLCITAWSKNEVGKLKLFCSIGIWEFFHFYPSGNAIQTLKSKDDVKVITVRGTAFEAAEVEGGEGVVEDGQLLLQYIIP